MSEQMKGILGVQFRFFGGIFADDGTAMPISDTVRAGSPS